MKLFYGSLNPILTPVVPKNESLNGIKKVIIIMGSNGNNITKRIMKQLHYLIPESATIFHHSSKCKPLLKSGILLDVSPSPVNSRSRNIYPDPGTRVESDHSYVFNFQRIGDQRLTFLQVDYYDDSYRIGAMEEFFGFCWSKVSFLITFDSPN